VLNEDGVAREVAVNDGRVTGVQVTDEWKNKLVSVQILVFSTHKHKLKKCVT